MATEQFFLFQQLSGVTKKCDLKNKNKTGYGIHPINQKHYSLCPRKRSNNPVFSNKAEDNLRIFAPKVEQ
ncbi:hypothetical protein GCM10027347_02630 [Larkinella harenae]